MDKPERIATRLLPRRVRWTTSGHDCWRSPHSVETCPQPKTISGPVKTEQLIAMCEITGPFSSLPSKHGSATHSQTINPLHLQPVDSLDVTIVVDNAIDILLPSDERTKRPCSLGTGRKNDS